MMPAVTPNKIMADTNLCIVMLDKRDLDSIEAFPASIVDVFSREAHHAMDQKKLKLRGGDYARKGA